MVALAGLVGCTGNSVTSNTEKQPGGPGITSPSQKEPHIGEADNTYKLPSQSVSLKQGESKEVKMNIDRGKNFDKDVTLKLADVPKDVEITPKDPVIKHSETGVVLIVKATDTAAVGDFKVNITGEGGGKEAKTTLEIKVSKK
jgi:uncharacterized membrane protein